MSIMLDRASDLELTEQERSARLRAAVNWWLDRHELMVRALGEPRNLYCWVDGRRVAGHECFDCEFETESGNSYGITVSIGGANGLDDHNAEVVDAVSALTLIAMLLGRLKIMPMLLAG